MNTKHVLFVDESGKPDFDDQVYRHFLLVGVIIPESEIGTVSGYFSYIKRNLSKFENLDLKAALQAIEMKFISKRKMYGISGKLIDQFIQ